MPVPTFQKNFASVADMDSDQHAFFTAWQRAWQHNEPLEVDGQISFLFCHMYDVLGLEPLSIIDEMSRLLAAYKHERAPFGFYCKLWSADAYMLLGRYRDALAAYPEPDINGRSSTVTDGLLSVRVLVGERVRGKDIVTLNGPKTTPWGRKRIDGILAYIETSVRAHEQKVDTNLLSQWAGTSHKFRFPIFAGSARSQQLDVNAYSFSRNPIVIDFVQKITREAENTLREEEGIPRVGEGWIGETALFYGVKEALPHLEVLQHARPQWLGRQHLDIFIPTLQVALEYQGAQHDEPVAYFGGESAFQKCRSRDERKKRLCEENAVRLLYVREGYDLVDVVKYLTERPE